MIINCPGKCGRKVIAEPDGKAYLCRQCYKTLIDTLLHIIRPAREPHLAAVPSRIEETVA
jgi:hypothetical protein